MMTEQKQVKKLISSFQELSIFNQSIRLIMDLYLKYVFYEFFIIKIEQNLTHECNP